jgi:hypothetical protein
LGLVDRSRLILDLVVECEMALALRLDCWLLCESRESMASSLLISWETIRAWGAWGAREEAACGGCLARMPILRRI